MESNFVLVKPYVRPFAHVLLAFVNPCNHVAATLYNEFANGKGLTNPAYTEELWKWNTSTKTIEQMKIKDMDIRGYNKEVTKAQNRDKIILRGTTTKKDIFDLRPESDRWVTDDNENPLLKRVRYVLPKAVVISILYAPPGDFEVPPPLTEVANTVHNMLLNSSK